MGSKSKCNGMRRVALVRDGDNYKLARTHWKQVRNMRDAGSPIFVRAPRSEGVKLVVSDFRMRKLRVPLELKPVAR